GEVTAAKMHSLGIHTGADLKTRSLTDLRIIQVLDAAHRQKSSTLNSRHTSDGCHPELPTERRGR
ncbi:hypothetical protein, partial [Nostoc sp. 'Peltigera membranacea cyanobiont' 213]